MAFAVFWNEAAGRSGERGGRVGRREGRTRCIRYAVRQRRLWRESVAVMLPPATAEKRAQVSGGWSRGVGSFVMRDETDASAPAPPDAAHPPTTDHAASNGQMNTSASRPRPPRRSELGELAQVAKDRLREAQRRQQQERERQVSSAPTDARTDNAVEQTPAAPPPTAPRSRRRARRRALQPLSTDSFRRYMGEIRRIDLLQHEEEIELARAVQQLQRLEQVRAQLTQQLGRPPSMPEWAQAAEVPHADQLRALVVRGQHARDRLITANLRLVSSAVHKFARRARMAGVPAGDLMQEGTLGLIRAAERFDGSRGFRFSTFALMWIRTAVMRALADSSRLIRLPTAVLELETRLRRAQEAFTAKWGRAPSVLELAEEVGATPERVRFVLDHARVQVHSYDRSMKASEGADRDADRFLDSLAASTEEDDERVVNALMRDELLRVLQSTLDETEMYIVTLRFGLVDGTPKSAQQCAAELSISEERIRQIIYQAFAKLRQSMRAVQLHAEYFERAPE